jgi:hypothetical protein
MLQETAAKRSRVCASPILDLGRSGFIGGARSIAKKKAHIRTRGKRKKPFIAKGQKDGISAVKAQGLVVAKKVFQILFFLLHFRFCFGSYFCFRPCVAPKNRQFFFEKN